MLGKLSVFFLSYFAPDPPDPPGTPRPPYFFSFLFPRFRSFSLLPATGVLTLHGSVEGLLERLDGANRGRMAVAADKAPRHRGALDHEASSASGTRARVARVKAEHPVQLGYGGVDLAQRSLNDISNTPAACASPQSIPPEHGATRAAHRAGAPPFYFGVRPRASFA